MNGKLLFTCGYLCAAMLSSSAFAASSEIKVGANLEITGAVATFGQSAKNGMELAFAETNAKGGVRGKKLVLVAADNKSEPAESGNAITKLITKDGVKFVLGPVTSSSALAAAPIAQSNKVVMISPTATNIKVTEVGDYIFRACFIDDFQGVIGANFAAKTLKATKVAILVDNSSDYSVGLAKAFKETWKGKIAAEESFVSTDRDFRAQLTKIRATKPDVFFVPSYYQTVGLIIKQAREFGIKAPFVGGDGWDSPELANIAGAKALNNTFFTNHYSAESKDPEVRAFVTSYEKQHGSKPDALAALGYDAAKMLVQAITQAGSEDPAKVRAALATTKGLKGVSGTITIDAKRNPVKSAVVIEMVGGKQVLKEVINP